ncbi:MAG TPA: matrixin family metalloprotease [Gammaproteobacteria bacterium]
MMRRAVALVGLAAALWLGIADAQRAPLLMPLDTGAPIGFFVAEGEAGSGYRPSDLELARWALDAWERAAGGAVRFEPAPEPEALLRIHFVQASAGQYGEMRPIRVGGRRGADVFIRPDTDALGPDIARLAGADPLLRETIVYLTCLHEIGHALGLGHTANYEDVMYFFGFGGNIPEFFGRYRRRLESRDDIARLEALSAGDLAQLRALYAAR